MSDPPISERLLYLVELGVLAEQLEAQQRINRHVLMALLKTVREDPKEAIVELEAAVDIVAETAPPLGRLIASITARVEELRHELRELPDAD